MANSFPDYLLSGYNMLIHQILITSWTSFPWGRFNIDLKFYCSCMISSAVFSVCAWLREAGREVDDCRSSTQDQVSGLNRQKHNHKTPASFSWGYFDKHFLLPPLPSIKMFKIQ